MLIPIGLYACQELYKVIVPKHGIRADCYTEFTIPLAGFTLLPPFLLLFKKVVDILLFAAHGVKGEECWRFPNFTLGCRTFATPARFWKNSDG